MSQENKSTEERLLAALSHASAVVQGIGILVGVIVYVTQRDKSRYAAFQALHAAVFQLVNFIMVMGIWVVWGILYGLSIVQLIRLGDDAEPPAFFWIILISMVIPMIYMVVVGLYGLWGALRTWQGKDFRYLLIGGWLEKKDIWKADPPAE
jgi:uncharacterized Tic20 family protein